MLGTKEIWVLTCLPLPMLSWAFGFFPRAKESLKQAGTGQKWLRQELAGQDRVLKGVERLMPATVWWFLPLPKMTHPPTTNKH